MSKGEGPGTAVVEPEAEKPPMTPAAFDQAVGTGKRPAAAKPVPARLPVRIRVTFEEPAEFLDELEAVAGYVEGKVVRFIVRYDPPGPESSIKKVELVVGAVVAGEILELVAKAGQVWGDDGEADQATKKRVDTWHGAVVEMCGRTGLSLKGGRFGAV